LGACDRTSFVSRIGPECGDVSMAEKIFSKFRRNLREFFMGKMIGLDKNDRAAGIPSKLSLDIAATHPGLPAGALRAAWTGPGRDAG
jgi:hypothetical protein